MATKNTSKNRVRQSNAPKHTLRKNMVAHLSKELREKYNTRGISIRKGDVVTIMTGKFAKKSGKVVEVNTNGFIFVENIQLNKKDGKVVPIKINPSNVIITELYKDDEKRFKNIKGEVNGKQRK